MTERELSSNVARRLAIIHHAEEVTGNVTERPKVYDGVGMRTNVELDDRLVDEVMRRYRLRTKREAVDLALRRLVDEPLDLAEALALEGSGWEGDLAELRKSRRAAG